MASFSYNQDPGQDALIDKVERWADKVTPTGQSIGINRSSVYDQLVQAMRHILHTAPREVTKEASADGSGQAATNVDNHTQIEEPFDLLIFLNLALSSWQRPVYETIDPRSDQHRLQYNSYTQADAYNPIVSATADPAAASGVSYRCYPQDATPTIDAFAYLPETAPEDVPEKLKDPIVMHSVGLLLMSHKEAGVDLAFSVATRLVEQIRRGQMPMVRQAYEEVREAEES